LHVNQQDSHIHRIVTRFCIALKRSLQPEYRKTCFVPYLHGDTHHIDLAEVANLIYWMVRIQTHLGLGSATFGRWGHERLPSYITLPSIQGACQA
ncbi:hypothetical protein QBC40DRAFT_318204, partial [Triangularia verruculosa]